LCFFNDGFALRLVPAACVRSPVSLYHTVISHQVGSCDLRFQYVQCPGLSEEGRKYVFTPPSSLGTRTMRRPQWDSSSELVPIMLVTVLSMFLFILIFRIGFFVIFLLFLRRAQNPHLPESFLDDGGVLCGLLPLFLPDQSTILNHKRE